MKVRTKYYGELDLDAEQVITFPEGILGLESYKKYVLFEMPDNDKFFHLQSLDEAYICFLLIKPWDFYRDYEMEISDEELAVIHIETIEEVAVFNIVNLHEDVKASTANLLAPIIINADTREGAQILLREEKYATKHALFAEKEGETSC